MKTQQEPFITYGMVARLPLKELMELKEYINEKGIQVIYDKISPAKIFLVENNNPSGSSSYDNFK